MPGLRRRELLPAIVIRYQITDGTAHLDEDRWFAGISPDADFVQIREGGLSTRELARVVRSVVRRIKGCSRVFVNDRTDVAIACGAAGVHLRSGSPPPELVRQIAPPGFLISVACHNAGDVRNAAGGDYAILAPVFRPLSKPDTREPLGLAALTEIVRMSPVPVIALGGITAFNMAQCIDAGAVGVAGVSLFRPR
jgi:thiamine-phosphate pyrophosphorylase